MYESELRSHRVTLEAMTALLDVPALQVDEGRIFYCYPFTLAGRTTNVLARLLEMARQYRLGRATVVDSGELDVTDAWSTSVAEGPAYGGVVVTLDDLTITTTAGETLPPHRVELRATSLGTYYLRISAELTEASAHELNQAMRRGTAHMGNERIEQGAARWSRLSQYAEEVIAAVGEYLDAPVVLSVQRRHHAVLSIRALSVFDSSGRRRIAHYDDVEGALGARLFDQRINHTSATLEEYVRIPRRDPNTVIRDVRYEGEVIVRNAESTIILMPTTPNFVVVAYEEMAEFSASLPALMDRWSAAIFEQRQSLSNQLPSLEAVWAGGRPDRRSGAAIGAQIRELERRQSALRRVVTNAQSMLALVKSPALCQTAKNREILDSLFEAAGVPRLELHLDLQIDQVDALYLHVQSLFERLDERDQRRYRRLVEVVLAALAVTSLAGLFSLINGPFNVARPWVFVEVAFMLGVGLLVAVVAIRSSGKWRKD